MKEYLAMSLASAMLVSGIASCANKTANTVNTENTTGAEKSQNTTTVAMKEDKHYLSTYDVANAGNVTLKVMITSLGDSDGGPYLRAVMDNYSKLYSNVKLEPVEISMNELYTTLVTQTTAGTLPDIFTLSEAYSANAKQMGMGVSNLKELLGDEYVNGLLEAAVLNATVDGELVYMPWQNNTTAFVYRKDLFEEKHLEIPKTWDDFKEIAKKLTEDINGDGKIDRYGAVFAGTRNDSAESRFQTFALTHGMNFVTRQDDGSYQSGFEGEAFKSAMETFVNLAVNERICPDGFVETGYSEAYQMLASDTACMFFSASNVLGGIFNANPDMRGKFGSFEMPTAKGVKPVTSFSSVGMTVSSTSKAPEVAADFLKFLTSVDNSMAWNKATCRLPVVKAAIDKIVETDDTYSGFASASKTAVIYPPFAGLAELRDTVGECWQKIVSEGQALDEAVNNAKARAQQIINENK